jgi:hypothetical protein
MTVPAVRRAKEKQLCYLVNLQEPTLTARWIIIFISLLRISCFHILNSLVVSYSLLTVIRMRFMQMHIVQRGAVQPLIEMLQSPDTQLREMSAFALGRLAQVSICFL